MTYKKLSCLMLCPIQTTYFIINDEGWRYTKNKVTILFYKNYYLYWLLVYII